jgi:hypothetical protein
MTDDRKRHQEVAQKAPPTNQNDGDPDNRRRWRQDELYRIPPALVAEIEAWLRATLRETM